MVGLFKYGRLKYRRIISKRCIDDSVDFVWIDTTILLILCHDVSHHSILNPDIPFKPSRCFKASFYIPENRLNFPTIKGFGTKISMRLVYQYMGNFFNFQTTSNHLHPLLVKNCENNSRLVVDE